MFLRKAGVLLPCRNGEYLKQPEYYTIYALHEYIITQINKTNRFKRLHSVYVL